MTKKVVILGGGVAGLSAAHELIVRGFNVDVLKAVRFWGGKLGVSTSLVQDKRVDGICRVSTVFDSFRDFINTLSIRWPEFQQADLASQSRTIYGILSFVGSLVLVSPYSTYLYRRRTLCQNGLPHYARGSKIRS